MSRPGTDTGRDTLCRQGSSVLRKSASSGNHRLSAYRLSTPRACTTSLVSDTRRQPRTRCNHLPTAPRYKACTCRLRKPPARSSPLRSSGLECIAGIGKRRVDQSATSTCRRDRGTATTSSCSKDNRSLQCTRILCARPSRLGSSNRWDLVRSVAVDGQTMLTLQHRQAWHAAIEAAPDTLTYLPAGHATGYALP